MERYVKYRLNGSPDAEDLLQDICLTAYLKYDQLEKKGSFKPWILRIARNRCADYFREKQRRREIPLEEVPEARLVCGRQGQVLSTPVEDTLDLLTDQDREVLRFFYWKQLSIQEIAAALRIPEGTVKSRLHTARSHFKDQYPYPPKEEPVMTKLPKTMPQYTIEPMEEEPFPVRWEELQGWQIIPRIGEKLSLGLYDFPSRKRTEYMNMEVVGKAQVHGIEGVEMVATQYGVEDYYRTGCIDEIERRFIVQLTDTHSRFLAESHMEDGVRKVFTFLDGDDFLENWGFGEDNCGNEVNLARKGLLNRQGSVITGHAPKEVVDVVGRYRVTMNGKAYDTICVMDIQCFNDGVASEQYLDRNGRTILWRRFNKNDWALEHFGGKPWSEKLPGNEQLTINGETYVHWYDCLTDYVL